MLTDAQTQHFRGYKPLEIVVSALDNITPPLLHTAKAHTTTLTKQLLLELQNFVPFFVLPARSLTPKNGKLPPEGMIYPKVGNRSHYGEVLSMPRTPRQIHSREAQHNADTCPLPVSLQKLLASGRKVTKLYKKRRM